MKTNNAQQEIILVMETQFSFMLWSERNGSSFSSFFADSEIAEDACWNGILNEMLPELSQMQFSKQELYLWEIRTCNNFLELCFAESVFTKDNYSTIDPYSYRKILIYS